MTGRYRLPWARLHALKDYYGMVKLLDGFPSLHQTFNLVPSLLIQIEDYAEGRALDQFLTLALKPAEQLDRAEKEFILRYFFQANEANVINRYPRYAELFRKIRENEYNAERAAPQFDTQMVRDLQVLSQLAWFDEEYLTGDPEINDLVRKGRGYSVEDQALLGPKQTEALGKVLAIYRDFAERGQIELSASPLYHPILPLICDSNIGQTPHPYLPLPSQFAYPGDAEEQLLRARQYFADKFGRAPAGLWPSEGAISDQMLEIAARTGFHWTASDDGILAQTIGHEPMPADTYRPYLWKQGSRQIHLLFRDNRLSQFIGFVYSRMDPDQAARHFVSSVTNSCAPLLSRGESPIVPIILDGENAWENYAGNGRPFLRSLYRILSEDRRIVCRTISEALTGATARELTHVFPGSWIDANFDIWIGAEEDNTAWDLLLKARKKFDEVIGSPKGAAIPEQAREIAREELLIAEGSDWCWWYGPEHFSATRAEFDQLYRDHLGNVYRLLGEEAPGELGNSILRDSEAAIHELPSGFIQPVVDGKLTSRQEWQDAGRYKMTARSSFIHSRRPLIQELHYGTDGQNIFFRLDIAERALAGEPLSFHLRMRNREGEAFDLTVSPDAPPELNRSQCVPEACVTVAFAEFCEIRISMSLMHIRRGDPIFLQLTIYREGLPVSVLPPAGELELLCSPMTAFAF
ncbi:MAG: hypothetical protein JO270_05580 [Acidobacteriaceae bacterium]|nr:hypothetical protein [Acidobacteriaceae bacterium]MBV8570556.1 hypothetical protein [Acidobacteriaceae bacterium]